MSTAHVYTHNAHVYTHNHKYAPESHMSVLTKSFGGKKLT